MWSKLPIARCHCVSMVPIGRCLHVQSLPCKVPSFAYFAHRMVPSCAYVAHPYVSLRAKGGFCMVYPCAKQPASLCQGGKSWCQCVPSCPSQGAIVCQVAHHKPLCAKLPIATCHCVLRFPSQGGIVCLCFLSQGAIVWHIAHHKVPSCAKFIRSRCHRVTTFPIVGYHGRLSHGSPVCQVSHLMEPSCAYVPHVKVLLYAYVPHVKVPSCVLVTYRVCPLLCSKLSIAWGAPACQGKLSHDTCACKVAHLMVSLCAKVAHVIVPACTNISHVKVPS